MALRYTSGAGRVAPGTWATLNSRLCTPQTHGPFLTTGTIRTSQLMLACIVSQPFSSCILKFRKHCQWKMKVLRFGNRRVANDTSTSFSFSPSLEFNADCTRHQVSRLPAGRIARERSFHRFIYDPATYC